MSPPTLIQAAQASLSAALANGSDVVVLGEDVTSGGPFGLTKGLVEQYGPTRIRNTPISEGSYTGVAIGLALGGARPFVDLMFNDFLTAASDQLFNHAAKIHYMSGGARSVPLTVWTIAGGGTRWGAQHSQRLDGWLAQIPGLKVLAPSTPAMAAATVTAALDDPDPVVILVDRSLLYAKAELPGDSSSPWSARVVQEGDGVTVVTTGRLVHAAIEASRLVSARVEVVDLQRLAPLDIEPVCRSLAKTSHLVIAHDEPRGGAMSALIAAAVHEQAYWLLDGPVVRVTASATPVPAAGTLEDAYLVSSADIAAGIERATST